MTDGHEHVGVRSGIDVSLTDGAIEAVAPPVEIGKTIRRGAIALVRHVVRVARKRVNRGDVRTHARWQQTRGDGEILVVLSRELLARGVGPGELWTYHSISCVPARLLAERAMTNSKSDRRFT